MDRITNNVLPGTSEQVITAKKMILEYIRQLREAKYYSDRAVRKFAAEQYPWVNKENIQKCINLGKSL